MKLMNLNFQIKSLHYCGVLPPPDVSASPLKLALYNVFTFLSLLWFVLIVIAQFVALFQRSDDIEAVTAIMFLLSSYISAGIVMAYFVYKWERLLELILILENDFDDIWKILDRRYTNWQFLQKNHERPTYYRGPCS